MISIQKCLKIQPGQLLPRAATQLHDIARFLNRKESRLKSIRQAIYADPALIASSHSQFMNRL